MPSDRESAGRFIRTWSDAIARETLATSALAGTLRGSTAFIDQAAIDYAGRFLYELLQNAYDSHPRGSGGRGHITLVPDAGAHGILYVANAGDAFDEENFRAICEIAQSSKRPGQGIGNKGIGFKSFLLVSEWPEIYSMAAVRSNETFNGFCFSFAHPEDVLALGKGDATAATVLADRLSPYSLPVPIEPTDPEIPAFARAGMNSLWPLQSADRDSRRRMQHR